MVVAISFLVRISPVLVEVVQTATLIYREYLGEDACKREDVARLVSVLIFCSFGRRVLNLVSVALSSQNRQFLPLLFYRTGHWSHCGSR